MIEVLLDLLVDLFPWYRKKKRKKEEWYGFVEEKKIQGDYLLSKKRYCVVFRTDNERRIKIKLDSQEIFDRYEKGRRYHKEKGENYPEPVE